MKKMTMMLLMILTLFFTSKVSAETYEVKKGDWLAKIGKKYGRTWQKLYQANKAVVGENPDIIYPGQKLEIPASAKAADQYQWKDPGNNPFGKRDFAKAIAKFNLPEGVKKEFIKLMKAGEFSWREIKPGDRFEQMAFGDFKIINNVIASWKQGRLLAARLYAVTFGKKTYFLIEPLTCHNWAWWVEEAGEPKKAITPEQPRETPTVAIPELPVKSEVPAEKPKLLLIPPPVSPPAIVAEEKKPAPTPIEPPTIWKPSIDASTFAGVFERTQGEGKGSYWGVDANLYLFKYKLGDGILEAGLSFQYVGWKGYDYDIPMAANGHWEGYKQVYGIGSRYTTNNTETTLKARYGEKRGQFNLSQYRNEERNELLNAELYHTIWFERRWFSDLEVGLRADVDLGGQKDSWWDENKIPSENDRRYNQSEYMLSLKTEVYKGKYITPTLGVSGTYAGYNDFNGNNWFLTPQIGVKFFDDKAAINAEYQVREGSENNAIGIGLVIEIDKVLDGLVDFFQRNQTAKHAKQ